MVTTTTTATTSPSSFLPLARNSKRPLTLLILICLSLQGVTFLTSVVSVQRSVLLVASTSSNTTTRTAGSDDDDPTILPTVLPSGIASSSSSSSRRALEEEGSIKQPTAAVAPTTSSSSQALASAPSSSVQRSSVVSITIPDNSWWLYDNGSKTKKSANPCETVESLDAFLAHIANSTSSHTTKLFSQAQPICPQAAYHRINVVVPYYNLDFATLNKAIKSIQYQDYPRSKFTVWVYDDGSSQDKDALTQVCGGPQMVHSFTPLATVATREQAQQHTRAFAQSLGLLNAKGFFNLICFRSTQRQGPAASKFWSLQLVETVSKPNDVVMIVDGDDQLLHNQALQVINQKYLQQSAWFTYGSYQGKFSDQMVDLPKLVRQNKQPFQPRVEAWRYGHPRTFKTHLLSHLTPQDFQFGDGSWLLKGTECGMIFRVLELAGPSRIGYIPTKIYQYNYNPETSTLATLDLKLQQAHKNHSKFGMIPTAQPLQLPIHVVILVWQRYYLLQDQLTWLQQQQITSSGRSIHVHLVNNNLPAKDNVTQLVEEWKQNKDRYLGTSTALQITLKHMDDQGDGILHHNFARFVYVHHLRQRIPLDEVIFVDDDQYWRPDFMNALVEAHKPKGMTTWYGKTFQHHPKHKVALYWAPDQRMEDVVYGTNWPEISYYKYGGGGGAIYDTNLWLLDVQLQRLARDLSRYAKIDDLWASYVLDALLGWEIRRMHPDFMPVDIGGYQEMEFYRDVMTQRMSPEMRDYFQHKFLGHGQGHTTAANNVMKAATYLDPGVNKQHMFFELQTKFLWDGFTGPNGKSETEQDRLKRLAGKPKRSSGDLMKEMREQADWFRKQPTRPPRNEDKLLG